MKRLILIAISCIVVDQLKTRNGYLTNCKGGEETGQVVFDTAVTKGQEVMYRPFIKAGDDVIHGDIEGIDHPKEVTVSERV